MGHRLAPIKKGSSRGCSRIDADRRWIRSRSSFVSALIRVYPRLYPAQHRCASVPRRWRMCLLSVFTRPNRGFVMADFFWNILDAFIDFLMPWGCPLIALVVYGTPP